MFQLYGKCFVCFVTAERFGTHLVSAVREVTALHHVVFFDAAMDIIWHPDNLARVCLVISFALLALLVWFWGGFFNFLLPRLCVQGFYRGFGALVLQYMIHALILRTAKLLFERLSQEFGSPPHHQARSARLPLETSPPSPSPYSSLSSSSYGEMGWLVKWVFLVQVLWWNLFNPLCSKWFCASYMSD